MNDHDPFRPQRDPARAIYDAFQNEAKRREGRTFEEWHSAELHAVHAAARLAANCLGLRLPTYDEIVDCERDASGHADYGAKWAHGVARLMERRP